ncbi:MAG: carboxypeptidase-like regulatory domain-containing protein [Candidatus Pseudobacter hemicellulosilyticus]|uniref:Carboxypeptidase-like regulatory domain-containing protein n=1 Tax=Candidatus Pseudobacter hemicellulosilyticus TaxID=3121375 RepID=A0AAJ6BF73_9BACT|nr:MAG: carboxypeptidase-like regulatory domain-containing protein [Pseudobacter sp.]
MKHQYFLLQRLLLLLCLLAGLQAARAQVNVTLTLRPPYSAYIKDYYHLENKAVIVLTNTTRQLLEVKLGGSLTNESRGVYIRTTPQSRPPMPITLGAGATVVLSANADLMRFLDQNNISTNANDATLTNILRSGKLPEGNYQLCIQAYDYLSGRQLSPTGTGCASFDISQADPPMITFPQNDHTYPAEQKNLNFSWTPPMGNLSGALIEYDQVVVRVQPGQNPNDAIAAARDFNAGNPQLSKKNMLMQAYITQPYDLAFEPGRYAMQVIARDRNNKILLNNQGRSEIVVFEVGRGITSAVPGIGLMENERPTFTNVQLRGTLRYYWPQGGTASAVNNQGVNTAPPPPSGGSGNGLQVQGSAVNTDSYYTGALLHNRAGFATLQNSPLAGITVQLYTAIQFENPKGEGSNVPELLPGNILLYAETVLATATTGSNGSFSFNVPNINQLDFSWKEGSFGNGGGEINWTISGRHRTVLMVRPNNSHYYFNPIQFVSGLPQDRDMGTFYARVSTFNSRILVTEHNDRGLVKPGVEVLFMRRGGRAQNVPRDEGSPGNFSPKERIQISGTTFEVVWKGTTGSNGEVLAPHMVLEDCTDGITPYSILTRNPDEYNTVHSLHHSLKTFQYTKRYDWNPASDCLESDGATLKADCADLNCMGIGISQYRYSYPNTDPGTEYYYIKSVVRAKARAYAQVKNKAGGIDDNDAQNLAGARWCLFKISRAGMQKAVSLAANGDWGKLAESGELGWNWLRDYLHNEGTPPVMHATGLTGNDGRIDVRQLPYEGDFNNPTAYYYVFTVEKHGFKTSARVVNLKSSHGAGEGDVGVAQSGTAYNLGEIWMEPKGEAVLTIVNERGNPVVASAWYYDHNSGQNGEVFYSSHMPGVPESKIAMNLPSGNNRRIVIQPYNTDTYERDTIIVNVPASGVLSKEVLVKYKLHRIYFNIRNANGQPIDKAKVRLDLQEGAATMYNDIRSPYLYEGAHSPVPNDPIPGGQLPGNQSGNGIISSQDQPELEFVNANTYTKTTNNGGGVDFAFRNSGTSFRFIISGPNGSSYVVKMINVSSRAGKTWKRVQVELKNGRTVKGTVHFGQVPVANARVRVKGSVPLIETWTNAQGQYELHGVPLDTNLTFSASKSGYVGMEFTEGQSLNSVYGIVNYQYLAVGQTPVTTINFKLRIYDGLDLSKLLGFPLEVTSLEETAGAIIPSRPTNEPARRNTAPVKIGGLVTVDDANNQLFKMSGSDAQGRKLSTIEFSDLLVVADDIRNDSLIPYCRPQTLPVATDINEQVISIYDQYVGTLYDSTVGITLNKYQQQGVAQGKVRVETSSFADNAIGLQQGNAICLVNGGSMQFPVFTAGGPAAISGSQGIGITGSDGQSLRYTLHNFTAIAGSGSSRLYKDSVVLDTRLQTALQHVPTPNINLPIGKVRINSQRQLENVSNAINVTMALGSFQLLWKHIYIGNDGVTFDATLDAAGMQLPISRAILEPTRFRVRQGSLETGNVKLLNSVPVTVHSSASFGYDETRNVPAWYVSITSESNSEAAATINGQHFDGLNSNYEIPFTSLWFYSNGDQQVNLASGIPVFRLHNIADFSLQAVLLHQNLIQLQGELDLGIPAFPSHSTSLNYDKQGNGISGMRLQPFVMTDIPLNGVVLGFNGGNSNSIEFSNGRIRIRGRVRDEDPEVFKDVLYTITKTSQETRLVLDETPQRQSIRLGGSSSNSRVILTNIEGSMQVTNNSWTNLYFYGDMPEDMGFTGDGRRMKFDVLGAIQVNNQAVKLKSMETPIGGMNMIYDLENARLMGSLHIDNKIGSLDMKGDAEVVIDKYGYYFLAGGSVEMSNPKITGRAFILMGDYTHRSSDRRSAIEDMLKEYSYYYINRGEMPKGYTDMTALNGFFIEAGATIPVPGVPNFDIDLVVLSAALEVNVGGDVRLGMQFGETNMYSMGMAVWVEARFSVGISGINVCAGTDLRVMAGVDLEGFYYSNGNYSMTAEGYVRLQGTAWYGIGFFCTAACEGACVKDEAGGTIGLAAVGTVTQDGSDFRIVLDANTFK